jgi:chromosome segregation ATPase
MANKENTEKSNKQYYKTKISELEKSIQEKDRKIHDLRNRVKHLESKLKQPKSSKKPATKPQTAREKALEIRNKMAAKNKPEGQE